jgi:hypothetical protein
VTYATDSHSRVAHSFSFIVQQQHTLNDEPVPEISVAFPLGTHPTDSAPNLLSRSQSRLSGYRSVSSTPVSSGRSSPSLTPSRRGSDAEGRRVLALRDSLSMEDRQRSPLMHRACSVDQISSDDSDAVPHTRSRSEALLGSALGDAPTPLALGERASPSADARSAASPASPGAGPQRAYSMLMQPNLGDSEEMRLSPLGRMSIDLDDVGRRLDSLRLERRGSGLLRPLPE